VVKGVKKCGDLTEGLRRRVADPSWENGLAKGKRSVGKTMGRNERTLFFKPRV
jgi:hypothetical protein